MKKKNTKRMIRTWSSDGSSGASQPKKAKEDKDEPKETGGFDLQAFVQARATDDRVWRALALRHTLRVGQRSFDGTCLLVQLDEIHSLATEQPQLFELLGRKLSRAVLVVIHGGQSETAMSLVEKCCKDSEIRAISHYAVLRAGQSRTTRGRMLRTSAVAFGADLPLSNPHGLNLSATPDRRLFFGQRRVFDSANAVADWVAELTEDTLSWWWSEEE